MEAYRSICEIVRDPPIKVITSLLKWCDVVFGNPCYGTICNKFFVFSKTKVVEGFVYLIIAPNERSWHISGNDLKKSR
jgi:hypothetical protein